jgi:hypothetical protein
MNEKDIRHNSDLIGMISSIACIIHCLALPILLSIFANSGSGHSHSLEFLDFLFILIGLVAVIFSSRSHHSNSLIRTILWSSFFMFTIGILLRPLSHSFDYMSYLGSLGLIVAHGVNYRICMKATH